MKVSSARVRFSRQANDGNYGSETISIEREVVVDQDDDGALDSEVVTQVLHQCRLEVEDELRKSPNWSVQRAVTYAELEPAQVAPDIDDDELP